MSESQREPTNNRKKFIDQRVPRAMYSGALGLSIIAVTQLIQRDVLDTPLLVSLYCFSITIPTMALAVYLLMVHSFEKFVRELSTTIRSIIGLGFLGSIVSFFIGMFCLFLHFSIGAAIVFAVFSGAAFAILPFTPAIEDSES